MKHSLHILRKIKHKDITNLFRAMKIHLSQQNRNKTAF